MFFCCGVHDSIKKHGIKECAVEYGKMFYGPVMNKVTENRENQGTESNVLQEEIHHKLPLSEGGTHDRSNLIALCKSCHSQIHAKRGDRWHDR